MLQHKCRVPQRHDASFIRAMYPDSYVLPEYHFGLSPVKAMHNSLKKNKRDLYQTFKNLPDEYTVIKADNRNAMARYAEAEFHDFYHQMRIGAIPLNHRHLLNILIDQLLAFAPRNNPDRNKFASMLAVRLIDMDHVVYEETRKIKAPFYKGMLDCIELQASHRFWTTISMCADEAALLLSNKNVSQEDITATTIMLAEFISNHDFGLNNNYQDILDSIVDFKGGYRIKKVNTAQISYPDFSCKLREMILTKINNEIKNTDLTDLVCIFDMITEKTVQTRILKKFVLGKMSVDVEKQLIVSIQVHHHLLKKTQYSMKAGLFMLHHIIVQHIIDDFNRLLTSGVIHQIPREAFSTLLKAIHTDSEKYAPLMDLAINHDKTGYLLSLLCDKKQVMSVISSEGEKQSDMETPRMRFG